MKHTKGNIPTPWPVPTLLIVPEKLGVATNAIVCPEGSPPGGCIENVPSDVDTYVLVDVVSLSQLPPLKGRVFRIGHRAAGDEIPGDPER
ncbi:phosphoesterase [Pyrobaculum sp.]|uniref:phosphoesterase n=1 Tax=Pyrobaculum sp. TaxID=2004705 RepID=UPI0031814E2F